MQQKVPDILSGVLYC